MTQVFQQDGSVARVTVLEAGPCPVTAIRTPERDGYQAVQLAFGLTKEKHLTRPELGHLKKADAPPMKTLVEFRGEGDGLSLGDSVTVDSFEVGDAREDLRHLQGQGLPGHDQAPQLRQRPQVPRLAQRARTGLDRRIRMARARDEGHPRPRADGQQARHAEGPRDRLGRRQGEPAAGARLRTRPVGLDRGGPQQMPDAPVLGAIQEGQARRRRVRRPLQRPARPPERARRAGRAPPRHRGDEDPRHGLRRRRQALAPEGHRPRPRRLQPLADLDRRWHRLRSPAPLLHLQGQPQGAARRVPPGALPARRARLDRDPRQLRVHRARRPARRSSCSTAGTSRAPRSWCSAADEANAALSFRNLARVVRADGRERRRHRAPRRRLHRRLRARARRAAGSHRPAAQRRR